ncbi:MAG: hypothetical protein E2590_11415 [Chryseobacterium sp.]|nr:hypothetical protein [Chryseobacterium sp.]
MSKIFLRLYERVSYWGLEESGLTLKNRDSIILTNQYLFLLAIIFSVQSFFSFLFIGFGTTTYILLAVSSLFYTSFAFFKSLRTNKYAISFIFLLLCSITTYYSSLCGLESGIFLFYFPMLSAVFIFFSIKENKLLVIFILLFILSNLYLSAGSNFTLIRNSERYFGFRNTLLLLNISCMLSILMLNSYFFQVKREEYYFTLNRNLYKREQIENLKNELVRVRELISADDITEESLKHLVESAQINDALFVEKFNKFFPDFYNKINNTSSVPLTLSDLKYCGMLKLGFTTKQIAIYTNSSIKSVESKKYRLRKKLAIQIDENSKDWFSNI